MADNNLITAIYNWIDKKSNIKYYPYYLALFLMLCSLVFTMPRLLSFNQNYDSWETVILKANDLTNSLTHIDPKSWLAKKVFRLTVPIIMRITQLQPLGIIILQYLLNYLLIVFCYKLSLTILKDPISSTFIAAGIIFIYFGRAGFYDLQFTWFDGFAFFCLIMALYCKNIFAVFLFSLSAAWTDERAFIALTIVLLFHQLKESSISKLNFNMIVKMNRNSIAVLFAMVSYFAIRSYFTLQFNMRTPTTGANLSMLKETLPFMTMGLWTFLEGFWLLFLFTIIQAIKNKNYIFSILILMLIFVFTIISGCVADITRSGSYIVPIIFVLLIYLYNFLNKKELRLLLFICFIIAFLFPAVIICSNWQIEHSFQSSFFIWFFQHLIDFF